MSVFPELEAFRAVSYRNKLTGKSEVGAVAQEQYPLFPEFVVKGNDDLDLEIKVPDGASGTYSDWDIVVAGSPGLGDMLSSAVLSDVNKALARRNLGVGGFLHSPIISYQHFSPLALHGVGWETTGPETGGVTAYTAAAAGDYSITLNTAPSFPDGQLIVFVGTDGTYYGAVVKSLSGAVVNLKHPLQTDVAAGNLVSNFWANEDHPNQHGYRLMVDQALRDSGRRLRLAYKWKAGQAYRKVGTAAVSNFGTLSYGNPGSTASPSLYSEAVAANDGIILPQISLPGGSYIARITWIPNLYASGTSVDTAATYAFVTDDTGISIGVQGSMARCAEFTDIPIFVRSGHSFSIQLASAAANTGFAVSQVEIFECYDAVADINFGTHVVIGDSYIAQGYFTAYLATRLPNATTLRKARMIARVQASPRTPTRPTLRE